MILITTAIWAGVFLPRVTPLVFGMAAIAIGAVFGPEYFSIKAGPLPATVDRVLWIVLFGLVIRDRFRQTNGQLFSFSPIDFVLLTFVCVLMYSTFTHDWRRSENLPLGRLLFFQLIPISFFWIGRHTRFTERDLKKFAWVAVGFGIYLAFTGLAEKLGLHGLVFPQYIVHNENIEFFGRARGPFINPVGNGLVLLFCLSCCCLIWKEASQATRSFVLAVAGLMVLGIACTMTRSVWLALVLSAGVTVWFCFPVAARGLLITSGAVAAVVVVFVLTPYLNNFKRDEYVSQSDMQESLSIRPMLFAVAYEMGKENPMWGHGYGQYKKVSAKYHRTGSWDQPLQSVRPYLQHNIFLAYFAELGLIGLALAVGIFGCFLQQSFRLAACEKLKSPHRIFCLISMMFTLNMVVNGMFHDVSLIVVVGSLYFYVNGLTYSIADKVLEESASSEA